MINVLCDDFCGGLTGIGRYYREIIKRAPQNIKYEVIKRNHRALWYYPYFLAKNIKQKKPDVFWSPGFMPPLHSNCPFVITIHDLIHLNYYSVAHKIYYHTVIKYLAKRAFKIMTVSDFSKNDIVNRLNINKDRITTVYPGVDEVFFSDTIPYFLDRPYFLYVGNRRKYKNIERSLRAFAQLTTNFYFVLTGDIDKDLLQLITKLGIQRQVKFVGKQTDKELVSLYKGAVALVFVSLYEGFGIPNIEALACGTNVVTSNISAMPEVVNDQGIIVDPHNVETIKNGLKKAIEQYPATQEMKSARIARARTFNWDNTAKTVWGAVQNAYEAR